MAHEHAGEHQTRTPAVWTTITRHANKYADHANQQCPAGITPVHMDGIPNDAAAANAALARAAAGMLCFLADSIDSRAAWLINYTQVHNLLMFAYTAAERAGLPTSDPATIADAVTRNAATRPV